MLKRNLVPLQRHDAIERSTTGTDESSGVMPISEPTSPTKEKPSRRRPAPFSASGAKPAEEECEAKLDKLTTGLANHSDVTNPCEPSSPSAPGRGSPDSPTKSGYKRPNPHVRAVESDRPPQVQDGMERAKSAPDKDPRKCQDSWRGDAKKPAWHLLIKRKSKGKDETASDTASIAETTLGSDTVASFASLESSLPATPSWYSESSGPELSFQKFEKLFEKSQCHIEPEPGASAQRQLR